MYFKKNQSKTSYFDEKENVKKYIVLGLFYGGGVNPGENVPSIEF